MKRQKKIRESERGKKRDVRLFDLLRRRRRRRGGHFCLCTFFVSREEKLELEYSTL
jgi:hypothetical protein